MLLFHWDWPGWLPHDFLTVLASEPGVGKSFLALAIAASYIDGRPWPDGTQFTAERGKALWAETEYRAFAWLPTPSLISPCPIPYRALQATHSPATTGRPPLLPRSPSLISPFPVVLARCEAMQCTMSHSR